MLQEPTLRPLWRSLSVADVARRIHVVPHAVQQALRTTEGRERVRQRLARALGVQAHRLTMQPGPTGAVRFGDVWLEVPVGRGWVAASRLALQAGRLVVAEFRVFPDEETALRREGPGQWSAEVLGVQAEIPPGGLTARTLRAVRLGEHPKHVREVIQWIAERYGADAFKPGGSLGALGLAPEIERSRPRREAGRSDSFFAELADDYLRRHERGSAKPNAEIAAKRGKDVKTITGWLNEARARGLLTSPGHGKVGGTLTEYGARVLREARREKGRREGRPGKTQGRKARPSTTKRRDWR
ncbi:MAG: hypothetical protein HY553_02565 [Elusimicrobia bacterium]|nr:hypothetical protein [Elusimicrobiota bacterium]